MLNLGQDFLGEQLLIGDFVAFIRSHGTEVGLILGKVKKFNDKSVKIERIDIQKGINSVMFLKDSNISNKNKIVKLVSVPQHVHDVFTSLENGVKLPADDTIVRWLHGTGSFKW